MFIDMLHCNNTHLSIYIHNVIIMSIAHDSNIVHITMCGFYVLRNTYTERVQSRMTVYS